MLIPPDNSSSGMDPTFEIKSRQSSARPSGKFRPTSNRSERYVDLVYQEESHLRRVINLQASPIQPAFENFKHLTNLRYLNLSSNSSVIHVGLLEQIPTLKNLFKLDLSNNKLMELPGKQFFAKFPCLQVLYLHDNNLTNERSFHSIEPLKYLIYLTIFSNPLNLKESRSFIINKMDSIRAIDFQVVLDYERGMRIAKNILKYKIQKATLTWPLFTCSDMMNEDAVMKAVYRESRTINKIFTSCSDVITIQRYARGYILRKEISFKKVKDMNYPNEKLIEIVRHWRKRAKQLKTIRKVLLERGAYEHYIPKQYKKEKRVKERVAEFIEKLKENVSFRKQFAEVKKAMKRSFNKESALYKTPDNLFHIMRYGCFYIRQDQYQLYCSIISELSGLMSRVLGYISSEDIIRNLCQDPEQVDTIYCLKLPQYKDPRLKCNPVLQLLRCSMKSVIRYRKPFQEKDPYLGNIQSIPLRRKIRYTLNTYQRNKFYKTTQKLDGLVKNYERLIRISLPDSKLLYLALKRLFSHNRSITDPTQGLYLFCDAALKRNAAAVKIQSTFRRFQVIKKYKYRDISWEVGRFRAAIFIQRWVRQHKFQCRMLFLENLDYYLSKLQSNALYIPEDVYVELLDIIAKRKRLMHLKDQELRVLISLNSNLIVIRRLFKEDEKYRKFIPEWIKHLDHPIEAENLKTRDGDIMHLLHIGTKITKKVKYNIRFYKIEYPSLSLARYTAAAIALMTFTLKDRGHFIKVLDKDLMKQLFAKNGNRERYLRKIEQLYDLKFDRIQEPKDRAIFLKKNENNWKIQNFDNCGFLFTQAHSYFKELAEKNSKNQFYQIRVCYVKDLKKRTYLMKTEKHNLQNIHYNFDYIYFIPYNYFTGLIKYQEKEGFSFLKTLISDTTSAHIPDAYGVFSKQLNQTNATQEQMMRALGGTDPKANLAKQTNLLIDHYKRKEVENRKKDREYNQIKIQQNREEEQIKLQEKVKQQREYQQFRKSIIAQDQSMVLQRRLAEKYKTKAELEQTHKDITDKWERDKRDNIEKIKIDREIQKTDLLKSKVPQGYYVGINVLLDEEVKHALKKRKEQDQVYVQEKIRQIKERRLNDKAWNLILKEVKRPTQVSFLKESDKEALEQNFCLQMGKVGLSIDGAGGFSDSVPKPTHNKIRKLIQAHNAKVAIRTTDEENQAPVPVPPSFNNTAVQSATGTKRLNQSFGHPNPHRTQKASREDSLNKSAFPYIHGKIAEEFYPIDRNSNKILPSDL